MLYKVIFFHTQSWKIGEHIWTEKIVRLRDVISMSRSAPQLQQTTSENAELLPPTGTLFFAFVLFWFWRSLILKTSCWVSCTICSGQTPHTWRYFVLSSRSHPRHHSASYIIADVRVSDPNLKTGWNHKHTKTFMLPSSPFIFYWGRKWERVSYLEWHRLFSTFRSFV